MVDKFTFHSMNKDHVEDIKVHLVLQLIGVESQIALKKASEMEGEFTFHSTIRDRFLNFQLHLVTQTIGVESQ